MVNKRKVRPAPQLTRSISVVSPEGATADPLLQNHVATSTNIATQVHPGIIPVTYTTCLAMSRTPVVNAVIATRQNQVVDYSNQVRSQHMNGWVVGLRQPHAIPSRKDRFIMAHIAGIIETAGGEYQPGGFEQFLRSLTYYTLTVDQAHIQPIMSAIGKPVGFRLLDPTTIRRKIPFGTIKGNGELAFETLPSAQYLNGRQVHEFAPGAISWSIRNALPSVYTFGYGYPELAMLINAVTAILNAQTHNAQMYTTGYMGSAMVAIKSLMGPKRFEQFENAIQAMLTGVRRNKSVPIIQLNPNMNESLEVHPFSKPPDDMQFSQWVNWNVRLICSLYGMDPIELGIILDEGKASSKNKSELSPQDRIVASKERSLRPLLRWIARQINETIIWPYWPDYQLEFYGFDSVSESQKQENLIKAVQNFMSVNEVRAVYNLPPWRDPVSNRPLNASYQVWQQKLVEQGMTIEPDIIQDDVAAFVGGRRMARGATPA